MKIDDILQQEKFRELDLFLTEEMRKYAGKDLVDKMINAFDSEERARNWFYSSLLPFGGKRAYDLCRDGNFSEVENTLARIEDGEFSRM